MRMNVSVIQFIAMRYEPRRTTAERLRRAAGRGAFRILGPFDEVEDRPLDGLRRRAFRATILPRSASVGFGRLDVGAERSLLRLGGFARPFVQGFLDKPPSGLTELWSMNPESPPGNRSYTQWVLPGVAVVEIVSVERLTELGDDVALVIRSAGLSLLADPEPLP